MQIEIMGIIKAPLPNCIMSTKKSVKGAKALATKIGLCFDIKPLI